MFLASTRCFTVDLFRHARSTVNDEGKTFGTPDARLHPIGMQQSLELAAYLKRHGYKPDIIYSSTLTRAAHTADIVADGIGYPLENIVRDENLVEIRRGEWTGKDRDPIMTSDELRLMALQGMDHRAPGGESLHEVAGRMHDWVVRTLLQGPEPGPRRIAVFSHGLAIKCLLSRILGNRPDLTWRIDISNTSITTLSHDLLGWQVRRINALPHLDKFI